MPNLSEFVKSKKNRIGPSLIVQWAQANKANHARPDENLGLLQTMLETVKSKLPADACLQLSGGGMHTFYQLFAEAIHECEKAEHDLESKDLYLLRKSTKLMAGFCLMWQRWGYPACRYYYTASSEDAAEGCSGDFQKKHLATTDDAKSGRAVARIRATDVEERTVSAFGPIVTAHSGALTRTGTNVKDFMKEIKGRQREFAQVHAKLCQYFADNVLTFAMPDAPQRFAIFDGITFVTERKYNMFEFFTPEGGKPQLSEDEYYVHFSVSATSTGDVWAVHHLARTAATRNDRPNSSTLLSDLGIAVGDGTGGQVTYLRSIGKGW